MLFLDFSVAPFFTMTVAIHVLNQLFQLAGDGSTNAPLSVAVFVIKLVLVLAISA